MTAREKFTRALRDGRILRNAKGHIVIPEVVKPGVVLTPTPTITTVADLIRVGDTVTARGPEGQAREFTVTKVGRSGFDAPVPHRIFRTDDGGVVSLDLDHPVTINRPEEESNA